MSKNLNLFPLNNFFELLIQIEHDLDLFFRGAIYPGVLIFSDDLVDEIYLLPGVEVGSKLISEHLKEVKSIAFAYLKKLSNFYSSSFLSGFGGYFKFLLFIIFFPLFLSLFYSLCLLFFLPRELNIEFKEDSLNEFFQAYFYAFSWYGSWLGVLYNLTAVLGVTFAVMTYYKNNQSQASINHFSNVQLFREYAQSEISKSIRLSPASFDLMSWYSCIYPLSKDGVLFCSSKYKDLIGEYNLVIESSNFSAKKNGGFKYVHHQAQTKKY